MQKLFPKFNTQFTQFNTLRRFCSWGIFFTSTKQMRNTCVSTTKYVYIVENGAFYNALHIPMGVTANN